jgi:hypothetical protein
MLFKAYLDDSADRNRERIVVSGAIVGDEQQWACLNRKWRERLAQDGLLYFKSSHCNSLNGQFHKFRSLPNGEGKQRADKIRDDLDAIIRNSELMTLGGTLPVPFHKVMLADPRKFGRLPTVPYRLVFQQVLAECAYAMIQMGRNHIVTFAHDDGEDFRLLHSIYRDFKKANPRYSKVMAEFVPLGDKTHPPIQAADVAAWVTFRYAEEWAINPSFDNLKRMRESVYKMVIWTDHPRPELAQAREGAPVRAKYVI